MRQYIHDKEKIEEKKEKRLGFMFDIIQKVYNRLTSV